MQVQRVHHLTQAELEIILDLHLNALQESTLNQLGRRFLSLVYKTALVSEKNIFLVLKDGDTVIGYAVATINIDEFYNQIMQRNFLLLFVEISKITLKNPVLLIKILIWMITHKSDKRYPAELQFIAVNSKYQGKGLGTKLMKSLNEMFKEKGISNYKVGTWSRNSLSNKFYQKLKFTLLFKDKVLGIDFNYYLSPTLN